MSVTKRPILALLGALCCAAVAMAQTAPTTQFQLDGTAAANAGYPACQYGAPCDTWDLINGSGAGPTGLNHSVARSFKNGESSTLAFTQGGSKDFNDIPNWRCTSTSTPNKDTLTNGYAAAYNATNSDLELIFGADRLSINGDANIGVWFFQQTVACDPATGMFSGTHQRGDIFVISAFVQGGSIPLISVYDWEPSCASGVKNPVPGPLPNSCADSNLRLLFSAGSLCYNSGTLSSLDACAITNSSTIPVSWPYPTAASAVPSSVPAQALFTGGADITHLLSTYGGLNASGLCFTSFLEETRSSQSTSAVLKDFLGGSFPLCGISVAKTCNICNVVNQGSAFQYEVDGTVSNTGAGTVHNVVVTDNSGGLSYNCPDLTAGATKKWGYSAGLGDCTPNASTVCQYGPTGTCFNTSANPAQNSVSAVAYTGANSSGTQLTANFGPITCASCAVNPGLQLTKECKTSVVGNPFGVLVNYDGTVQNTGNDALNNVVVTEQDNAPIDASGNPTGTFAANISALALRKAVTTNNVTTYTLCTAPCSLAPNEKAYFGLDSSGTGFQLSYAPTSGTLVTLGRVLFGDTVGASGVSAIANPQGQFPTATATPFTAACPLCPLGACPTQ